MPSASGFFVSAGSAFNDPSRPLVAVWDDWPRSVRRGTLEWIKTARTTRTRQKRIDDVVDSAAANRRPTPFRR
ncbi:YdeI/OmpD-associated family protein [Roseovarius atlanticus]|uniref:YdeI/OmpD-associated family protein n=1 Tax=Roseovarius atlanticus TaxID=1641875 RepID=UPI001C95D8E4|nr:YdeI/OmpD-associated family protein [Roseovarius atlanticus]MBY5986922.1 YdeI/OmpD-associated family protein [Roseovarius atlanticus]MBY6125562.1 YdeI/OmpD-associated family protein [Roseovarius atlanticus]MBY6149977.1 YdeI/OmpD-associated family protein [Roseovarius atlanticus]